MSTTYLSPEVFLTSTSNMPLPNVIKKPPLLKLGVVALIGYVIVTTPGIARYYRFMGITLLIVLTTLIGWTIAWCHAQLHSFETKKPGILVAALTLILETTSAYHGMLRILLPAFAATMFFLQWRYVWLAFGITGFLYATGIYQLAENGLDHLDSLKD